MYNEILTRLEALIVDKIRQRNIYEMKSGYSQKILSDLDFNIDTLELTEALLRKLLDEAKQSKKKQPKKSKYLQNLSDYHFYATGRPLPHY